MAMRRILYERGGIYHVGNEGAHGAPIALDEHDLTSLARELRSAAAAHRVRLLAWCVLPCSYQLLAQPLGDPSVSLFLQCVFNRYSKRFNHRHSRSGSLFAGPYSAERIDNDRRLALLCRRVHLLPVIHGCAATPELWPHSDFAEWIDATACMRPLQHLDAQTYAAFVEAGRMP
jgi:putative transposase